MVLTLQGKVVIIGAGPAGLAAATSLKRNGIETVLLEARERIGGRVHSYKGDFNAPIDLGASLITGMAAGFPMHSWACFWGRFAWHTVYIPDLLVLGLQHVRCLQKLANSIIQEVICGVDCMFLSSCIHASFRIEPCVVCHAGVQANVAEGLRPDPSAVICRQLGIPLHRLDGTTLPIYQAATGQKISDTLDKQAEK